MTTTITITGNLVADPELRYTQTGTPVASFRIAQNNRRYDKQAGQWVDGDTYFHQCSIWRGKAEAIASLTKGTPLIVTGTLHQRQWEDQQGNKRTSWEIQASDVGRLVLPAKDTNQQSPAQGQQSQQGWSTPTSDDNVPF